MKVKWENGVIGLLAIVIFGVGCLWFVKNYELKEIDSYTGYRGEARSNDLFAARLFLKRMGIPTTRKDALLSLPDVDTVVVLNTSRYTMSPQKTQTLLDWVATGGHLVTRARVNYVNEAELAADEENQQKPETEDRDALQQALQIEIGTVQMFDEEELPFNLQLATQPKPLRVDVDFFNELLTKNPNATIYHANDKNFLLQIKHGQGLISLAATLEFAENHLIDKVDHAEFFWWLLHSHNANFKHVWLINQDTLPSLSTLLIQYAWPILWMVALLLLASFWALIPRFGAFIPEPIPERRRILEHIKASGQFMWKHQHKSKQQLLDSTRQAIRQTARTHIPGWQWLETAQQTEQLTQHLKLPSEQNASLHHLLTAPQLTDAEFIRLVQLANSLRKTT